MTNDKLNKKYRLNNKYKLCLINCIRNYFLIILFGLKLVTFSIF